MRRSRTVGASGDSDLGHACEEERHRSETHGRPVSGTHLAGASGPRLAVTLESRERGANRSADIEAPAVAAVISLTFPAHIPRQLIDRVGFATFDQALRQAERHRGVIGPFPWPQIERTATGHV